MHENVTTAHMVALSSLRPTAARNRIVCSAMDFPSMIYLYRAQQAAGFELRVVPAEDDLTVRHRSHARGDRRARTARRRLLARAVPHVVHHGCGARSSRRAREVGATVILDTYQSAGIIPVDVDGARRRLRGRRLPEMAVRRAGQRVSLHAARLACTSTRPRSPAGCRVREPFAFDIDESSRRRATTRCG